MSRALNDWLRALRAGPSPRAMLRSGAASPRTPVSAVLAPPRPPERLLLEARPGGQIYRPLPSHATDRARAFANLPILYPHLFLSLADLEDTPIGGYGASALVDGAVDQIILRGAALTSGQADPDKERSLTPFTALLLGMIREETAGSALPFAATGRRELLRTKHDALLAGALHRLASAAASEGILSRESMEEAHGELGGELYDQWREAIPFERGLQHVLSRAALPIEPFGAETPPSDEEVEACRRRDPETLAKLIDLSGLLGEASGAGAPRRSGERWIAVELLVPERVAKIEAMLGGGLDPRAGHLIGVPGSSRALVAAALLRLGLYVEVPPADDPGEVAGAMRAAVSAAIGRAKAQGAEEVLVFEDPPDLLGGIAAHLDRVLARISMPSVARRSVAVLGFGPAGRAAAEQLRRALAEVTVYEPDATRRQEAKSMGFEVTAEKAAALADRYAILCASGGCVIAAADVGALAHETVLANVSSRLAEIALGPSTPSRPIEVVPLLSEAPGDRRFMTRAWRYRDKDLVVVRGGFPIEGPERE